MTFDDDRPVAIEDDAALAAHAGLLDCEKLARGRICLGGADIQEGPFASVAVAAPGRLQEGKTSALQGHGKILRDGAEEPL